jgi:hypothetical protein
VLGHNAFGQGNQLIGFFGITTLAI